MSHEMLFITAETIATGSDCREVYYQGFLVPQSIVPTFDKGYLLAYNFEKIDVYAPDGSPLYSVSAEVPNAKIANIQNAAADADRTMAGAVYYARGRTRGGGILLFDRSGKQTCYFDTGQYWPTQVCFAPINGSIFLLVSRGALPPFAFRGSSYFIKTI